MDKNCCKTEKERVGHGFLGGLFCGLLPHAFCIGFVLFSIIGSVSATAIFKKFLIVPYFFQTLMVLSFLMATISAVLYLKKNGCLCKEGLKSRWKYLAVLYGITIFVNLLMFFFVFPAMANINSAAAFSGGQQLTRLSLAVQIPCSGHAPLIINELKKDSGIKNVVFKMPNIFQINYNPDQTSPEKIISIEIFKTYKATIN